MSKKGIALNRLWPGCHKYRALSEKALGKYDECINTMIKACVYETPWDDKHVTELLDLYDLLVAGRSNQVQ
jgi:hypothetical protein